MSVCIQVVDFPDFFSSIALLCLALIYHFRHMQVDDSSPEAVSFHVTCLPCPFEPKHAQALGS